MAKDEVKFSCGCGFQTRDLLTAMAHADEKKHTLDVLGKIHPNEPKARNQRKEDVPFNPKRTVRLV